MIHRTTQKTTGFSLVELMVVIGIMAMLIAMIITATQSLQQGNRVARCHFKLQQIGNAMKAYHFDWGTVPPRYPGYDDTVDGTRAFDPDEAVDGPGLMALWDGGYLTNRRALHCPSDIDPTHPEYSDPNNANPADNYGYYGSYMRQDPDAATILYDFNNCKYLSTRGVVPPDPYFKRQLEEPAFYDPSTAIDSTWYPDDGTIVTWCNLHAQELIRQGEPMYQVLFWDGSVKVLPWWLFDGPQPADPVPGLAPDAAWKVTPDILE